MKNSARVNIMTSEADILVQKKPNNNKKKTKTRSPVEDEGSCYVVSNDTKRETQPRKRDNVAARIVDVIKEGHGMWSFPPLSRSLSYSFHEIEEEEET